MAFDAGNFWGSNHYKHPPLTEEMVAFAESELGVKLPPEYLELLRIQNGGYTLEFGFPMTRTTWAEDHVPLHDLAGIVTDHEISTAQNILATAYLTKEWDLPQRQVLMSGDGHWWITLDYRNGEIPSVAWIDVECDQDLQLAPTFNAFLEGLRPVSEYKRD